MEFENIKDINTSEDEQNKQMNFPQRHHGFASFSGSHHLPLRGRSIEFEVCATCLSFLLSFYKNNCVVLRAGRGGRDRGSIFFSLCIEPWGGYWKLKHAVLKAPFLASTCFGWSITISNSLHLSVAPNRLHTHWLPCVFHKHFGVFYLRFKKSDVNQQVFSPYDTRIIIWDHSGPGGVSLARTTKCSF